MQIEKTMERIRVRDIGRFYITRTAGLHGIQTPASSLTFNPCYIMQQSQSASLSLVRPLLTGRDEDDPGQPPIILRFLVRVFPCSRFPS